uniref:Uncharacterized protein n=1 Tax=Rhizophora mucronata TaxID=61149 RepID=A0A2P2NET3_RHIMU
MRFKIFKLSREWQVDMFTLFMWPTCPPNLTTNSLSPWKPDILWGYA